MVAHLDIRGIALLVAFALLAFAGLRHIYLRRLAARMFTDHESAEPALGEVRVALEEVNRECRTHTFFASRLATIAFHDHPISLVDGWALVLAGKGANNVRCVFTVAHGDEAHWLRRFSDVFEPAFSGSVWSVFWVKLPTLMRLTRPRDSANHWPLYCLALLYENTFTAIHARSRPPQAGS
jgi:hypothetical protein